MKIKRITIIMLAVLLIFMMLTNIIFFLRIKDMSGDATLVNKTGVIRGGSQRLVKMELVDRPSNKIIALLEKTVDAVSNGSDEFGIKKITNTSYQKKIVELNKAWTDLKKEIFHYRKQKDNKAILIEKSEKLWDMTNEIVNETEQLSIGKLKIFLITILVCIGINIFLILFIRYVNLHLILSSLLNVSSVLKNIAQENGDLTVRLPVKGNDEIADLARYFNQTIEKIGSTIQTVTENAAALNNMGQVLSANMTETATSVNQISANIEGVKRQVLNQAAGVTETSAAMEQIIRTIHQLNKSIETQAASVAQSSSSIEQMAANIASVTQTLAKTDTTIQGLAGQTREGKDTVKATATDMQQIVEESGSLQEAASVIQNIASQTNLLAMNAAIEAAHAGDAGKGFAVVADEIRKLAEESGTQGKAIASSLKKLSGKIQGIAGTSKTVEEKFIAIFEVARTIKDASSHLTASMQEQERGSQAMLIAMQDINLITGEVKAGAAEMLQGGEQVAEEMRNLDGLTRVITAGMDEMASGAVQINNAVQDVNAMSVKNKERIEALTTAVGMFRTA